MYFMHSRWLALLLAGIACACVAAEEERAPAPAAPTVVMIELRDAIGPATADFFVRSLKRAQEGGAALFVVQLDTPGGLDTAMRDMIRAILASPVPVAIYVAPSGARAASAGTYLLYASHIAAMAPATNLGAATPVQIGGSPPAPEPAPQPKRDKQDDEGADEKEESPEPGTAMERKVINDAVAYIRGLAELRGRNADWAETAVRTGASLSSSAALEQQVIDVIASDLDDLLQKIDGRTVKVSTGEVKLATTKLAVQRIETDWRTELLSVITNPNVAMLLMLIGVYGLLLEGYNPGAVLPGVIGGISLLLALYAFQVLSVNYAGLALMILGVALIVAEAFAPSFGALGLGGIIAFVIGAVILMDADVPGFRIARSVIGGIAAAAAIGMLVMGSYFAKARRQPVATGVERLLAERAIALSDFDEQGLVRIHGEIWNAITRSPVKNGQTLRVTAVDGLTLHVEPEHRHA
jgi:membrane-bound serine protease (ClpP class)